MASPVAGPREDAAPDHISHGPTGSTSRCLSARTEAAGGRRARWIDGRSWGYNAATMMDESLPAAADPDLRRGAVAIVETLVRAGHEAVFAGGCVRDALMGIAPKDYDIATSAPPEAIMALFSRCVPVGIQFGVVRVIDDDRVYEVATFRADHAYTDGRRPDAVSWSSAREDVLRRDFTVNGLLQDPLRPAGAGEPDLGGAIIDHVGGAADLAAGIIRAIGDPYARFGEDKLRLLRALRFAARFDFSIEPHTWAAIVAHAADITQVSVERVTQELSRLLTEGGAGRGLELLEASGLGRRVLPEIASWPRARARLSGAGLLDEATAFATLMLDDPTLPERAEEFARDHRLSTALARKVGEAVTTARAIAAWRDLPVAQRKRHLRGPAADAAFGAARLAAAAGQLDGDALRAAETDRARYGDSDLRPPRLLGGRELIAAGHPPGPRFQQVLEAVEDAQLEGRLTTAAEALAMAQALLES
jgi:poly(A) polymerase